MALIRITKQPNITFSVTQPPLIMNKCGKKKAMIAKNIILKAQTGYLNIFGCGRESGGRPAQRL